VSLRAVQAESPPPGSCRRASDNIVSSFDYKLLLIIRQDLYSANLTRLCVPPRISSQLIAPTHLLSEVPLQVFNVYILPDLILDSICVNLCNLWTNCFRTFSIRRCRRMRRKNQLSVLRSKIQMHSSALICVTCGQTVLEHSLSADVAELAEKANLLFYSRFHLR